MADLGASISGNEADLGPIGQAVRKDEYDQVILLSDHDKKTTENYLKWLRDLSSALVESRYVKLSSPTAFGEIYEAAVEVVSRFGKGQKNPSDLVFHLSPGTPAMAAVWIILAKTRFLATLIESSKAHGVRVASVPFDISADYLPDLLRKPDEELQRLSLGLPPEAPEFDDIVHRCQAMKRIILKARKVAPRNIPVLLLGESGTGKELLARAIHHSSTFKDGPLIPVNCGAIPEDLVESELFGHEKGAFTGATQARKGYIEAASGGTLFLDEVGELLPATQVKLLRVLQERLVVRVGATKGIDVHFRLIAATNRDLMADVAEGKFREDLFHRIAVAILSIPPLRERDGDVGLLIDAMLKRVNGEAEGQPGYEHKNLSASARNFLINYTWPGNVRELVNTLQRAAVWSTGSVIGAREAEEALLPIPNRTSSDILGQPIGAGFSIQGLIDEVARHYLSRAMAQTAGNKTKAAELLGLPSYQTLSNWLSRYGVE